MVHNYQKRWVFTWNASSEGQLIDPQQLVQFLNRLVESGVFQKEQSLETSRFHYQGRFELKGPRTGKKQLLKIFSKLGCVKNLTFEAEISKNSANYCTKLETRVDGPFFVGSPSDRRKNKSLTISLRKWQQQLLNELNGPLSERLRDRTVIWIQDPKGGSGKSTFLKYLALNQEGLRVKKLPLDKPDRLRMMVCKIVERETVDAFSFDFTRTLGTEIHIENLFQIVEEIKNGHIVSAMYGNPMEVVMTNPFVIIFSNEDISKYCHYLSMDRWQAYEIRNNKLYEIDKNSGYKPHDLNTRYRLLDEQEKKV